jgi:hypothetical protein
VPLSKIVPCLLLLRIDGWVLSVLVLCCFVGSVLEVFGGVVLVVSWWRCLGGVFMAVVLFLHSLSSSPWCRSAMPITALSFGAIALLFLFCRWCVAGDVDAFFHPLFLICVVWCELLCHCVLLCGCPCWLLWCLGCVGVVGPASAGVVFWSLWASLVPSGCGLLGSVVARAGCFACLPHILICYFFSLPGLSPDLDVVTS